MLVCRNSIQPFTFVNEKVSLWLFQILLILRISSEKIFLVIILCTVVMLSYYAIYNMVLYII